MPEGVVFDGPERALLIRDLSAAPEGQVERQDADDPVDEAACHEPGAREDREQPRVDEALAG